MTFAETIRKFRTNCNLTQEALGERVGVSGQAVSKWETSDAYPDPTLLPALADALGVTIDALFGHETHSLERLTEEFSAMLSGKTREEQYRLRFEVLAALFRTYAGRKTVFPHPEEFHQFDLRQAVGFLSENEAFPYLTYSLEPKDGWRSVCEDERLPGFLATIGDQDVFRCVLWIFGHERKPIEASLLVKKAGADPTKTDEILEKLVKIGAIALETYVINGRERVIVVVTPALWIKFKGPMLSFLSAAYVLTSCNDGHRTYGNNSDPPFLKY